MEFIAASEPSTFIQAIYSHFDETLTGFHLRLIISGTWMGEAALTDLPFQMSLFQ